MATPTRTDELPEAIVRKLVKERLANLAKSHSNDDETWKDVPVHNEAMLGFRESVKIFIKHLSYRSYAVCQESNRQILAADDVLKALEVMQFAELVDPLKAALQDFRNANESKKLDNKKKVLEKQKQ